MTKKQDISVTEIVFRAKALYLSTLLPEIDKNLIREYMGVLYPNEIISYEKVSPVANILLIKFLWWYLKLFKSEISNNKSKYKLFESTLFSLFENNFHFNPEKLLKNVNRVIPEDVYETNWFEREIVNKINKNEFGVLESISELSVENHLMLTKKIWNKVWKIDQNELQEYVSDLNRIYLNDYLSKKRKENKS